MLPTHMRTADDSLRRAFSLGTFDQAAKPLHFRGKIRPFRPYNPCIAGIRQLGLQRPGAFRIGVDQKDGQRHKGSIDASRAFFAKPLGL